MSDYDVICFVFCKEKTAYEMLCSDWTSDVCSSDLRLHFLVDLLQPGLVHHVALGHDAAQALDRVALLAHLLHLLLGAVLGRVGHGVAAVAVGDRKSTRLNSSH